MNEDADFYKYVDVMDGQADIYDHMGRLCLYCHCYVSFVGVLYEVSKNVLCGELIFSLSSSVRASHCLSNCDLASVLKYL